LTHEVRQWPDGITGFRVTVKGVVLLCESCDTLLNCIDVLEVCESMSVLDVNNRFVEHSHKIFDKTVTGTV
jgi:hypothetical protein